MDLSYRIRVYIGDYVLSTHTWSNLVEYNISEGSMSLEQNLVEDEIHFGSVYSSAFKCQIYNTTADLSGKWIKVVKEVNSVQTMIFYGLIDECKKDYTGTYRDIEAYDYLYTLRSTDISNVWNEMWANVSTGGTLTLAVILSTVLSAVGITWGSGSLISQTVQIEKNLVKEYSLLTFESFLHALGEICGIFWKAGDDSTICAVSIDPTQTEYDISENIQRSNSNFEDYQTDKITSFDVYTGSEKERTYGSGSNPYPISNNFLLQAASNTMTTATLTTTLPVTLEGAAAATVGKYIFIFGGYNGSYSNKIYRFYPKTGSIKTMTAVLPTAARDVAVAAKKNRIYIFGGQTGSTSYLNTIYYYDTDTDTIANTGVTLPFAQSGFHAFFVNTSCYLTPGNLPNSNNYIYEFSVLTMTVTRKAQVPGYTYMSSAGIVGTDIYLFGGKNLNTGANVTAIYKYDTTTNTFTTMTETYGTDMLGAVSATYDKKIYLLGGFNGTTFFNLIICYDTETDSKSTLSARLPYEAFGLCGSKHGNVTYVFGGTTQASTIRDTISKMYKGDVVLGNLYNKVKDIQFNPCEILTAEPDWTNVVLGNRIKITTKQDYAQGTTVTNHAYILGLELSGVQLIDVKIKCPANGQKITQEPTSKDDGLVVKEDTTLEEIKEELDTKASKSEVSTTVASAVETATRKITGADGGYIIQKQDEFGNPSELIISNKEDYEASDAKVWRFNYQGLGYSSTGYYGTYTLAMTSNGQIVADFISTGTLNASLITVSGLNTSDLTNDSDFQTGTEVETTVTSKGYQTASQVDTAITSKGYQTASDVDTTITSKGYQTASQVDSAITAKGYQTASDVETTVESYGYQTSSQVDSAISTATGSDYIAVVPLYYLTNGNTPSAPTSEVTSTSTSTDTWSTVVPTKGTAQTGYFYYTCTQRKTKNGTLSWSPVVLYLDTDGSTKLTKDTVTTAFVNALDVTAANIKANSTITNHFSCDDLDINGGSININTGASAVDVIALLYQVGNFLYKGVFNPAKIDFSSTYNGNVTGGNYLGIGGLVSYLSGVNKANYNANGHTMYDSDGSSINVRYGQTKKTLSASETGTYTADELRRSCLISATGGNNSARQGLWLVCSSASTSDNAMVIPIVTPTAGGASVTAVDSKSVTVTAGSVLTVFGMVPLSGAWSIS